MGIEERIEAFVKLGQMVLDGNSPKLSGLNAAIERAHVENPWFTPNYSRQAIQAIATHWLRPQVLKGWIENYPKLKETETTPRRVAVVMAGNVPFVGFHDLLCVLLTGHIFIGKASSRDGGLVQALIDTLIKVEPRFKNYMIIEEGQLPPFDAVIATGSDNSSRYFEYYFAKYPHIIRKNRSSMAILSGNESEAELQGLAHDIFNYFGLGCRNVSLLMLPDGYHLPNLLPHFEGYNFLANHHRFMNNYEYNRALFLMNNAAHFDNGFCTFIENPSVGSPVGVVHYIFYKNITNINSFIELNFSSLQSIVAHANLYENAIPFGNAQYPSLVDYADGIDTIRFLMEL